MKRFSSFVPFIFLMLLVIAISSITVVVWRHPANAPSSSKEPEERLLVTPNPAKRPEIPGNGGKGEGYFVDQITNVVTSSPYTSQTMFRGDLLSWNGDVGTVDVGTAKVNVVIPDIVHLFCFNSKNGKGQSYNDIRILWREGDRSVGIVVPLSKIKELFPSGSKNFIAVADVDTTGKKTAYLVNHIGCRDSNYPVKVP